MLIFKRNLYNFQIDFLNFQVDWVEFFLTNLSRISQPIVMFWVTVARQTPVNWEYFLGKTESHVYHYASANASCYEVCGDVKIMILFGNNEKPVEATSLQSTSTTASVSTRPTVGSSKQRIIMYREKRNIDGKYKMWSNLSSYD